MEQTLTSIYDAIAQTEDQFKLLFGSSTITRETIDNEVKSQLHVVQELRQRREDEERRLAEASQIPKTVSDSIAPAKPKTELVILGKEFALSELARIRAMSAKDYSHFISSLRVSDDTHGYQKQSHAAKSLSPVNARKGQETISRNFKREKIILRFRLVHPTRRSLTEHDIEE